MLLSSSLFKAVSDWGAVKITGQSLEDLNAGAPFPKVVQRVPDKKRK